MVLSAAIESGSTGSEYGVWKSGLAMLHGGADWLDVVPVLRPANPSTLRRFVNLGSFPMDPEGCSARLDADHRRPTHFVYVDNVGDRNENRR